MRITFLSSPLAIEIARFEDMRDFPSDGRELVTMNTFLSDHNGE
jgi:hypothetical protein